MSQLSASIPSQDNAIKNSVQSVLHQIHTAFPGKIVQFDPHKQTAQVQPMIDQVMRNGQVVMLPVLLDVPVQFPRAGGFALTFPIEAGDEGQVIINERCIDGWFACGEHSQPLDYRMFDLSDASFIPGISSLPRVISDFAMDSIVLRTLDNSAYIKIDKGGNIEANGKLMTIKCPLVVEQLLTYQGGMMGSGGSGSSATIEGDISVSGDVKAAGVSLVGHTHIGDSGGITGRPNL